MKNKHFAINKNVKYKCMSINESIKLKDVSSKNMLHPVACLTSRISYRSYMFTFSDATNTKSGFFNVCYLEHLLFNSCATKFPCE